MSSGEIGSLSNQGNIKHIIELMEYVKRPVVKSIQTLKPGESEKDIIEQMEEETKGKAFQTKRAPKRESERAAHVFKDPENSLIPWPTFFSKSIPNPQHPVGVDIKLKAVNWWASHGLGINPLGLKGQTKLCREIFGQCKTLSNQNISGTYKPDVCKHWT